jgi:hypothetical protein
MMRILMIVPASDIGMASEVMTLANGHLIDICSGNVDRAKLTLALGSTAYDVLHFAQHGNRLGLQFSDGLLEAGELVGMLLKTQRQLKFILLNACDSIPTAIEIHNALLVPVIAHNSAISDAVAIRFCEAFYRNLRVMDLHAAFASAQVMLMRLFPESAAIPQLINGGRATIDELGLKLDICAGHMTQLQQEMSEALEQVNIRMSEMSEALEQTAGGRQRKVGIVTITLLGLLLLAQIATPLLNATLIHR